MTNLDDLNTSDIAQNHGSSAEALVTQPARKSTHTRQNAHQVESLGASKPKVVKPKVCLTDYATPANSVSAFCRAILLKVIPPGFFGHCPDGKLNRQIVMKHVDCFIKLRRFESLSLHEVCKGLKVRV